MHLPNRWGGVHTVCERAFNDESKAIHGEYEVFIGKQMGYQYLWVHYESRVAEVSRHPNLRKRRSIEKVARVAKQTEGVSFKTC